MTERPVGTVTLLFTDIEGSTRVLQAFGERYANILEEHRQLLRTSFLANNGSEVDTQGDSFFIVFERAVDAVSAALAAQRAVAAHPWPEGGAVRVRMAIHTGEPMRVGDGYVGLDVHRAARLCAAAHGGQVLLSQTTSDLVSPSPSLQVRLRDLGVHRLKDLQRPERIYQLEHPELPADFPPLRTLAGHPNNLSPPPTPLIGRDAELAAARELLLSEHVRVVTLTGTGGTGKTRLALAVAASLLEQFADGVFVVALAPIADPTLVVGSIAQVIGVRDTGVQPLSDRVRTTLRDSHLLLVLDNFEQVLASAPLIADLLGSCPRLKVLVTSRTPLHLRGEHEFQVPPLALPETGTRVLPEELGRWPAIALFVERARAVQPDFALAAANAGAIAEICTRLDGLPLAIELAAARSKMLSPEAIVARLEQRFRLLAGGPRDSPPRQQTMRDAIAWSYELLDRGEQVLFRQLAVFAGGWTLDAAADVCVLPDGPPQDVMDGVMSLVDKSLVRFMPADDGESRYTMYETLRDYGREQLVASGELNGAAQRHAEYFLRVVEEAEPQLRSADQEVWLTRLEQEHDNLRSALRWTASTSRPDLGLRLAAAIWWFWHVRGYWGEAVTSLEDALARAGSQGRTAPRAKVLSAIGDFAGHRCDVPAARASLEESIAIWRELGDKRGLAEALGFLAAVYSARADHETSRPLLDESIAIFRQIGDKRGLAKELGALGRLALQHGEHGAARPLLEESLALRREVDDKWVIAQTLNGLGDLARSEGNYDRAKVVYEEALALSRALGSAGDLTAGLLHNLGWVARHQGDSRTAAALFSESLLLFCELADSRGTAECLVGLAAIAGINGHLRRAARLIGAAEAALDTVGASVWGSNRADYERVMTVSQAGLGETAFAELSAEGRRMTRDRAIDYALRRGAAGAGV